MKSILIHSPSLQNNSMFDPSDWNLFYETWIYLRDRLFELGFDLQTSDDHPLEDCAFVWFHDAISVMPYSGLRGLAKRLKTLLEGGKPFRNLYRECLQAGMKEQIVLFLNEPPSVIPANFNSNLHKRFQIIFTWHDGLADGKNFRKVYTYPQSVNYPTVPEIPFKEKKLLLNISTNKNSNHPHELYSARRLSIIHFEQHRPDDFDLYGIGWDQPVSRLQKLFPFLKPKYRSYRGSVKNKWDVMPHYRFALCYENISGEPGYVSEKVFDAMRCGCVPIYLGAPNIVDYVDEAAFVDRRKFNSESELENYLVNVSEQEYLRFQLAIKTYLASERFARFLAPAYAEVIIQSLGLAGESGTRS